MSACGTWPMSDAEVDRSARDWYARMADDEYDHGRHVRDILSARGRWLVVYEDGGCVRHRSKSRARGQAASARGFGIPARVIRYRRDRVRIDDEMPQLEVNDTRWLP